MLHHIYSRVPHYILIDVGWQCPFYIAACGIDCLRHHWRYWWGPRLVGVDSSALQVLGHVLNVGNISLPSYVTITEKLTKKGIQGIDFFQQHRCTIDLPASKLKLSSVTPLWHKASYGVMSSTIIKVTRSGEMKQEEAVLPCFHKAHGLSRGKCVTIPVYPCSKDFTGSCTPVCLLNISD